MRRAIVLLDRDLRLHDHPALHQAVDRAERVIPLFVIEDRLTATSPNRTSFLLDALTDLRSRMRRHGGDLVVRRGDPVDETMRLARRHDVQAVFTSHDVTPVATQRQLRLTEACATERIDLETCPGATIVPAGWLRPSGGDHYRVFTPYWRAWSGAPRRAVLGAPRHLALPDGIDAGTIPRLADLTRGEPSPQLPVGGETAGRALMRSWVRSRLEVYANGHDDLAGDLTSRLSPFLHLGCVSARELEALATDRPGGEPFVRQLCWRDFHHQVTAAFGPMRTDDYRPRGIRWRHSRHDLEAWQLGRTGCPIVDAGMRQLLAEGWLHNRARLITASFLAKDLRLDWRLGERHFFHWLVDGDVANNAGNWQWVAGTGNDTRPNRRFNPSRQAKRLDPRGDYVRRYVPELAGIEGSAVHDAVDYLPAQR